MEGSSSLTSVLVLSDCMILFSGEWADVYPRTNVHHLPRSSLPATRFCLPKLYYLACIFLLSEYMDPIPQFPTYSGSMLAMPVTLSSRAKLAEKLMRLKQRLRQWNKDMFRNIFENIKKAEEEVAMAERNFDVDPTDDNLIHDEQVYSTPATGFVTKEDFWHHKGISHVTV
ncbi:UNVERIFIED_CONTAM: hypothetical protein Sangu_0398200 [Sesamum angustifolium]|uniref:Uncharacterized protein n=1 Tax=Sesamum angustifolium TaxID=2727405 RepID=A0AAW2QSI5_9LAMI